MTMTMTENEQSKTEQEKSLRFSAVEYHEKYDSSFNSLVRKGLYENRRDFILATYKLKPKAHLWSDAYVWAYYARICPAEQIEEQLDEMPEFDPYHILYRVDADDLVIWCDDLRRHIETHPRLTYDDFSRDVDWDLLRYVRLTDSPYLLSRSGDDLEDFWEQIRKSCPPDLAHLTSKTLDPREIKLP